MPYHAHSAKSAPGATCSVSPGAPATGTAVRLAGARPPTVAPDGNIRLPLMQPPTDAPPHSPEQLLSSASPKASGSHFTNLIHAAASSTARVLVPCGSISRHSAISTSPKATTMMNPRSTQLVTLPNIAVAKFVIQLPTLV